MIITRLTARIKFILERWLQRGIWHQVLVMAFLIVLVAVLGGATVWFFGSDFEGLGAAVWWSFLRLTDPGYLGDDEGALMRTVSTIVTVLGYVLFMGSLIAIMTQWLARTMRQLESGTTPIAINGHILILGWTNRTPEIVEQIISSRGRLKRFLRQRGSNALKIVILAEEVSLELTQLLRERIGRHLTDAHVIFRSGSSLKVEHLRRVDLGHAAAVIVPGADFEIGGWELADTRIIKTLMSIARFVKHSENPIEPAVVAELFDRSKMPIARSTMTGELEIVASGGVVGGMIAQTVRNPGLSRVYEHLFSRFEPDSLFLRACPEMAGRRLLESLPAFTKAIPIGVIRPEGADLRPYLNTENLELQSTDILIFVARTFDDCRPVRESVLQSDLRPVYHSVTRTTRHKILIFGWSHKIISLLSEFSGYKSENFEIEIVSRVSEAGRAAVLEEAEYDAGRIQLINLVGDYTLTSYVNRLDLRSFDSIVFMASDNMDTAEQADARTVLGYALIKDQLRQTAAAPQLLLELMDGENAHLFDDEEAETIISPRVLSHLLAQIAMRRELSVVYSELFGPAGADVVFRQAADFEIEGSMSFPEIQAAGAKRGEIVFGYVSIEGDGDFNTLRFNPPRDEKLLVSSDTTLIVLTAP